MQQPNKISEVSFGKDIGAGHTNYLGIDTQNVIPGADKDYDAKIYIE